MTDNEIRGLLLRKYYERRREGLIALSAVDFGGQISDFDIKHVSVQLIESGLVEGSEMRGLSEGLVAVMAKITANGIDVVEQKRASPISLTINNDSRVSVAHSTGVVVASPNASQYTTVATATPNAVKSKEHDVAIKKEWEDVEREYLLVPRKTIFQFIADELLAYIAQILVALMGIAVATSFMSNTDELQKLANARINDNQFLELSITATGIFVLIGLAHTIGKKTKIGARFADELGYEIPRAIYFFGSSISALISSIWIHLWLHPKSPDASLQAVFALGAFMVAIFGFLYGCGFNLFLKWEQIKK